jgi:hypothetical protein
MTGRAAAVLLCFAVSARAAEPTRALKLGASAQLLTGNPFSGKSSDAGPGLDGAYEFLLSPRFAIGIALGYRQYFGSEAIGALTYGMVLKHYLFETPGAARPYLQYGLLQQLIHQRGHDGAAVAYDAGLMAGTDFTAGGAPLFVEGAFHVSHLSFLDVAARNQSYFALAAGVHLAW